MDCKNFEELSQLYIDAALDDERISQFEVHLLACNGCKQKMEYLQATLRGIESYPQLDAPSDLADNVMERIEGTASSWDFSQELVYITNVSRQLASGQLTRFLKAFATMIVSLILLPPRIYLRAFAIVFQRIHTVLVRWSHFSKTQTLHSIESSRRSLAKSHRNPLKRVYPNILYHLNPLTKLTYQPINSLRRHTLFN
ncbi:zf-HC2 domain-containing protein [Candidatus Poribacteria bacterium]|nr:zf-HC2 domain-containing protein [Candidatus Poribacteria bacterium]